VLDEDVTGMCSNRDEDVGGRRMITQCLT